MDFFRLAGFQIWWWIWQNGCRNLDIFWGCIFLSFGVFFFYCYLWFVFGGDTSWVIVEGKEGGTSGRVKSQLPSLGLGHVWGTTYIPSSLWKQAVASLSMTCMIQTQTGFIILHVLLPLRPHWFLWENLFFSFNFGSTRSSFQRRQCHPTPVLLPVKSHEQRSLEGCRPWGRWGSDMTERLHFHFSLSCIGERNGNPLHCSCLENPRDGGAWWAAICGVAQSQTRLKQLSRGG